MPKLSVLIDRHKRHYEANEKREFDKARRYFRGDMWGRTGDLGSGGTTEATRKMLCSKNLIYAIADTAVSALLGPNPSVAAMPRNANSEEAAPGVTGLMEYVFETNKVRRRAATALIDAVLCKRGIFKTGWSKDKDRPVIKAVDPTRLFFDLTVRDVDDISYWLEATPLPWAAWQQRVESGKYAVKDAGQVQPDRFPSWLSDSKNASGLNDVRDAFQWLTIWEYYDRDSGKVKHYCQQIDKVVFEEELKYVPYSMFSLNHNGVDCSGLSEVQLVLDQQETVNDLLTHMKKIAYLSIPRVGYDAGRITEEDLNAAVESATGSFVGMTPKNSEGLRALGNLFFPFPTPENPDAVKEFAARQEDDAAFISALAEAARGQVTGARTATEMAIIDAQMRTRLGTREGHLNDAMVDVASKSFYLCQKYMAESKAVRISGSRGWVDVTLDTIRDVEMAFKMVAYNPVQQNPGIQAETLVNLVPFLVQDPNVDTRSLMKEMIIGMGLPEKLILPEEEVAAMLEAQAQAAQQAALGGAAAGGGEQAPAGGAPQPSPEEMAMLEQQLMAAGAGGPAGMAPPDAPVM